MDQTNSTVKFSESGTGSGSRKNSDASSSGKFANNAGVHQFTAAPKNIRGTMPAKTSTVTKPQQRPRSAYDGPLVSRQGAHWEKVQFDINRLSFGVAQIKKLVCPVRFYFSFVFLSGWNSACIQALFHSFILERVEQCLKTSSVPLVIF